MSIIDNILDNFIEKRTNPKTGLDSFRLTKYIEPPDDRGPRPTLKEILDEFDCCVHNATVCFGMDKRSKRVLAIARKRIIEASKI